MSSRFSTTTETGAVLEALSDPRAGDNDFLEAGVDRSALGNGRRDAADWHPRETRGRPSAGRDTHVVSPCAALHATGDASRGYRHYRAESKRAKVGPVVAAAART